MHIGTTTVGLYDTLGEDAMRYVVDQTEMATVACSEEMVKKLLTLKMTDDNLEEGERKMHRLKNVISFE